MSGLQWQFDASGQLTTISEPNGNRITLSYSGANLTQISHSNGQQFTLEYNGQWRISRLIDHAGRATVYSYDGSGLYLQQVTALVESPQAIAIAAQAAPWLITPCVKSPTPTALIVSSAMTTPAG
jgi:YD repeat-containing protein